MSYKFSKEPLKLDQYTKYGIPQDHQAYVLVYSNISLEQADQLEADLSMQQKLFHSDLKSTHDRYELVLIYSSGSMPNAN